MKYLADNGGLQTLIQLIKDTFAVFDRNKQNKLRAGSNIIIDPATSTISATGGGGGSGSVDWGDISGTLTDQEDLADALDDKAGYNHTHSQSDVTGLADSLAGKASTSHTHQQSDVVGLSNALAGKANTSHTHAQSDVTGLTDALAGKASTIHSHGEITNAGTIENDTTPVKEDRPVFADSSDSNKVKKGTFEGFHKAMVSQLSEGTSDVSDGTEFLSSYSSESGFSDTNAVNRIYKRKFIKVWNYIQAKISSVLGLTAAQYNGNAATATSATNDSAGNNIASTYFPLAGRKAITGVYKDSPSLLHNINFGNTTELGIWRKFCLIYTRATYRNAVGAIHIQGRQTLGTIYVRLNSSATAPAEGNNTINPDVRYVSFVSNYNGIYYRVNESNQLELWFKAHEYYDNISVTDVDFGAFFLDLNMNSFLHSVDVAWTDEASVTQPDGLIQAGNVTNTTLSSAISSETGDVLIITDANYKNYLTTYQGGIPSTLYAGDILTLDKPYSTVIFDTTASGHVAVVTGDANVLRNGRRITILGNWAPQTDGGAAGAVSGRFSEYLYQYRAGFAGGGNSGVLQHVREEFLYYNGIWYSKGY